LYQFLGQKSFQWEKSWRQYWLSRQSWDEVI